MGAPKATATPAAQAALRISRRLAGAQVLQMSRVSEMMAATNLTFITLILAEESVQMC